eukprot:7587263-Pyramimonas_sp.AAC.1
MWEGDYTSQRSPTILLTRRTSGYLGGSDTTVDYVGHKQGHLQGDRGSMHYWLTWLPRGTDTKGD